MASAVAGQCGSALISRRVGFLLSSSSSTYSNGGMKLELRVPLPMQGSAMIRAPQLILAMAPKKKVNKYDNNWKKQWYGAGIFLEGDEAVDVDIVKKLEKKKVLSGVEKAGLLSKADELGFSLSSIEKMGLLSKAEELGLLSLVEKAAGISPAAMASVSLPLVVAAIATIVFIPDDSAGLLIAQNVLASIFAVSAVGLFGASIVLSGLQE